MRKNANHNGRQCYEPKPGKRSLKLRKLIIRKFEAIDEYFNCLKIEIY